VKRTALVGLAVLAALLTILVFYWTGYRALASSERVVYRVDRVTGEVTLIRAQVGDREHVLGRAQASESMAPRHILPSVGGRVR
jgi:hypothetical protein